MANRFDVFWNGGSTENDIFNVSLPTTTTTAFQIEIILSSLYLLLTIHFRKVFCSIRFFNGVHIALR